jgi:hypothetical protein
MRSARAQLTRPKPWRRGSVSEVLIHVMMMLIGVGVLAAIVVKFWPEEAEPDRPALQESSRVRVVEHNTVSSTPTDGQDGGGLFTDRQDGSETGSEESPTWTQSVDVPETDQVPIETTEVADETDSPEQPPQWVVETEEQGNDPGDTDDDGLVSVEEAPIVSDAPEITLGPALEVMPVGTYPALDPIFGLPGIRTEHYEIYSQLSDDATYDLAMRLESLYDYYAERFTDVYSPINFPLLVFFFNNRDDFVAAGGHEFMPGQFMGGYGDDVGARLMVRFNEGDIAAFISSCGLTYHENFHQFLAIEISQAGNVNRQWPLWLNESYATTFNNIIWTGDGWVDGIIQLSYGESAGNSMEGFLPIRDLMMIDGARWHEMTNEGHIWPVYMQGMSLIHFLNEYEGGRYRDLLATYVEQCSTGQDRTMTQRRIARLASAFENWAEDHMSYRITSGRYYEVFAAMAASYLARTHARGQRFQSAENFIAMARVRQLNLAPRGDDQWLPDTLRQEMLYYHDLLSGDPQNPLIFEIDYSGALPVVNVSREDVGLELQATFTLDANNDVESVDVEYIHCLSLDFNEAERLARRNSTVNIAGQLNSD